MGHVGYSWKFLEETAYRGKGQEEAKSSETSPEQTHVSRPSLSELFQPDHKQLDWYPKAGTAGEVWAWQHCCGQKHPSSLALSISELWSKLEAQKHPSQNLVNFIASETGTKRAGEDCYYNEGKGLNFYSRCLTSPGSTLQQT